MSGRNLTSPMLARIASNEVPGILLVDLTLVSGVEHIWSGVGNLVWNGNTYKGVGDLGGIGDVKEGLEVRADGTAITLSGIDSTLLNESLQDIQLGAPVTVWFGVFMAGAVLDSPYPLFRGTVDRPAIALGPETFAITLQCETKMSQLQRPMNRRYTSADQRYYYPNDIGFHWVEQQNDIAVRWG